ncbi:MULTISPECIES: molybdate ABC transporter substrate-binding protein [unclassified Pseudomonas]|uniref:molybdate ABC transporter substrate-binding protein n=1 Tax=unclassified Pseudomonas TaxID=196821 RepID=UPI00244BCA6C|nr:MULTISPECIES: molybdate ABC transporter substrate-binding protein [unclassified Pseudomonas]MDG9922975.1 molybdate ABC transporter substrate-binding protein [Pseudomonas sp. GD04045]MDH0035661.1 molybdate ABC transporter substrate-binding protein [Pseudomonas sp. GD04019]
MLRSICFLVLLLAGCPAMAGDLTVSAAASLTDAFREIAEHYQAEHKDTRVLLNFGASGALLQQVAKGAPVDVFASADQQSMDRAQQMGLVRQAARHDFAGNALVLVVPSDSTRNLARLDDLLAADRVAIGNPDSVPVGRYAMQALQAAGLWPQLQPKVVGTQNVRQSLDYVARGEVDAAFVYRTDARSMPDKVRVALEVPLAQAIRYPIAPIAQSEAAEQAVDFVDYVLSPAGQAVLARHGFLRP